MTISRPQEYLNWTTGQPNKVVAAPANLRSNGWGVSTRPPAQYINWQIWLLDQWVQYLDRITNTGTPNQVIRLINGGEWQFIASSGILSWSQNANLSIAGISDSNNIIPAGNCTLSDGDIAYVTVNPPLIILGDMASGSNIISNVNFTANLSAGMQITGTGIPSGTTIFAVGDSTLTISQNATITGSQTQLIAAAFSNLSVTVIAEQNFIPNLLTILIAKRLGPEIYVGVNSTQMILRDHEFKPFMGSGYFDTYTATCGENLLKGENIYISIGLSDGGRTAGQAYKLDTSADNQATRGTYAGTIISDSLINSVATFCYNGFFRYSGLIAGAMYWADPLIPGAITNIRPDIAGVKRTPIGFANTTDSLIISGTGAQANDYSQPNLKAELIGVGDDSNLVFNLSTYPYNNGSLFLFINGLITFDNEYIISGKIITFITAPKAGQEIYAQYAMAGQNYLQGYQETPVLISGSIYSLTGQPSNKDSLFVFIDRILLDKADYSLLISPSGGEIILNVPIDIAQDVYCFYLSPVGFSNIPSSGVTNFNNEGTGIGLFISLIAGLAKFKSLKNGSGISLVDDGLGTITISAPGVSGGLSPYGTVASPIIVDDLLSLPISSDQRQLRLLKSNGGAKIMTAALQISAGTIIGQELILVGTSDVDYLIFNSTNGIDCNGPIELKTNTSFNLYWRGDVWSEIGRR
jgi:hypothetical protein